MKRVNLYNIPHKALRKIMADFCILSGKLEPADDHQLITFHKLGTDMFHLLTDHTFIEDNFILKALADVGLKEHENDVAEHRELEKIQENLLQRFMNIERNSTEEILNQFYLDFSLFTSKYFDHIYKEEHITQPLLWKHYSDEELTSIRMNLLKAVGEDVKLIWYEYMIDAQSNSENTALMALLKVSLPENEFNTLYMNLKAKVEQTT